MIKTGDPIDLGEYCSQFIKPGDVCLDIGAADGGGWTQLLCSLGAEVHAIELDSKRTGQIIHNVEKEGIDYRHLHVYTTAIFSEPNRMKGEFKWDWITLDDFVEKNGIRAIKFIKIDVEGAELNVVEGGAQTLKRDQPVLMIETHADVVEYLHERLYWFLTELGYKIIKKEEYQGNQNFTVLSNHVESS